MVDPSSSMNPPPPLFSIPNLRVHVGAVQVHLAAMLVDEVADVANLLVEDAKGRRVRDL